MKIKMLLICAFLIFSPLLGVANAEQSYLDLKSNFYPIKASNSIRVSKAENLETSHAKVRQGEALVVRLDPSLNPINYALWTELGIYRFGNDGLAYIGIDPNPKKVPIKEYPIYLIDPDNYSINPDTHQPLDVYCGKFEVVRKFSDHKTGLKVKIGKSRGKYKKADPGHFDVVKKKFPGPQQVKLSPTKFRKLKGLRQKEEATIKEAFRRGDETQDYTNGIFRNPLEVMNPSDRGGEFWVLRLFRSRRVGVHKGTDFKTRIGTPVMAINSGKVILARAKKFSLEGLMVIIDHGRGIFSLYMHLSQINLKENDIVLKGEVIGLTGNTGRITGPCLHFAMKIKDAHIDPIRFLNTANDFIESLKH